MLLIGEALRTSTRSQRSMSHSIIRQRERNKGKHSRLPSAKELAFSVAFSVLPLLVNPLFFILC